jgi:hypothetical protein
MASGNFVLDFVQSCFSGKLGFSDCGPVWQMAVIAGLIVAAILFLILLRVRPSGGAAPG